MDWSSEENAQLKKNVLALAQVLSANSKLVYEQLESVGMVDDFVIVDNNKTFLEFFRKARGESNEEKKWGAYRTLIAEAFLMLKPYEQPKGIRFNKEVFVTAFIEVGKNYFEIGCFINEPEINNERGTILLKKFILGVKSLLESLPKRNFQRRQSDRAA